MKHPATKNKSKTKDHSSNKLSTYKNLAIYLRNPQILIFASILIYCLIGFAAYWPVLPFSSNRLTGCTCADTVQSVWFLRWLPYAISHGQNPFFTNWINAPQGANLAQNTLMPLLGLLVAPLSILHSPISSFNLLAWLAFPISGGAMFYVVRRLTGSILASFVAGLLYIVSPYIVGQATNHMMLSFIPLPPLLLFTSWKLFVEQRGRVWLYAVLLASEIIAQFLIEPEVLAITVLVIILGIVFTVIAYRSLITRKRLQYALKGSVITLVIVGVVLMYPIWFMLSGPEHFTGSNFPINNSFRSDLFGLVLPTLNEHYVPAHFSNFAKMTAGNDYPESGDYIGIPLLLFILVSVIRWRRTKWIIICGATALVFWILSLGPSLVVYGKTTSLTLPFTLLDRLPFLKDILPSRLSSAEWLLIPILVALSIMKWQEAWSLKKHTTAQKLLSAVLVIVLFVSVAFTLAPRWPYTSQQTDIPALSSGGRNLISQGSRVLAYPFPELPTDEAMLWQAKYNMSFKLAGGYIQNLGANGQESEYPSILLPATIQSWLTYEQGVTTAPWQAPHTVTNTEINAYLKNNEINTVIVQSDEPNAAIVAAVFARSLGSPQQTSGAYIWTHVQSAIK